MWPRSFYNLHLVDDSMCAPIRQKDKLPRPTYGNKSSKKAMFKHKKIGRIT